VVRLRSPQGKTNYLYIYQHHKPSAKGVPASKNQRLERVEVSQVQNGEALRIYSEGDEISMISPTNNESNSTPAVVHEQKDSLVDI
jgi:hypothetical protein